MNIYVGNLPIETTEGELRLAFSVFGQVIAVSVMNDNYIGSGQRKAYGFVEMASGLEGGTAILGLHGKMLGGRITNVVESRPLSKNGESIESLHGSHRPRTRERKRKE